MATKITVSGLDSVEQDLLNELWAQLDAKQDRNLLRAHYYDGKRAIKQVGSIIPPQYYKLALVLGWSAKAVDTLARRTNLDDFVWPDGNLDDLGLRELYPQHALTSLISDGLTSSMIHGVSFLLATRGDEDAGEPAALLHVKDALNATGRFDRTRRLNALLSILERDGDGKPTALALYLPNHTIVCEQGFGPRGGRRGWSVVDRQDHFYGLPAEPLVYRGRTGRPFGSPRISRTVMSLHDSALRTVIRLEGHADVYSFPEMWMLGADESMFKNADGTQKAAWQVMLGRIKAIPDDEEASTPRAAVEQFQATDPKPHLDMLKQQAQLFSGETSIPLTSLGVSDMTNPSSADSYIASREDLIAEAEGATDDWAPSTSYAIQTLLAIANGLKEIPPEWSSIAPKWRSPLYLSRAAAADAGSKQLAAVPWLAETEVGLELLGLDDQQIKRALAERRRMGGTAALAAIRSAVESGRPIVSAPAPAPAPPDASS